MGNLQTWEMLVLGGLAILVVFWFRPGLRAAFKQSREAQNPDWAGLLLPLVVVAAFIILLLYIV